MIFNICQFGAVPGATTLQTEMIQAAIDACEQAGGGTVLIPAGVFRTSTIRLCSHLTLELENGAILRGPDSIDDYRRLPFAWDLYPHTIALLYAENASKIRISGAGVIDFRGIAFARTEKVCVAEQIPDALKIDAHYEMPPRDQRPNRLVFFNQCEDVEISGVTFQDSPTWTLVFHHCSFLRLHDFRVENNLRIPNNDGIHCCGCQDVIVSGCFFNCGDDCIALTSISDAALINERIVISDCVFQSVSAALRIGFQAGKVRDVLIRNCIIHDSNRGIAIFAGKDGFVENVFIEGLIIDTRLYAGCWWGKGEPLVVCSSEADAFIRDVTIRNTRIRCENSIVVSGVKGSVSRLALDTLTLEIGYGNRRPFPKNIIDLSPNPAKPAPNPEKQISWLWSDGTCDLHFQKITATRKDGEKISFQIGEIIQ